MKPKLTNFPNMFIIDVYIRRPNNSQDVINILNSKKNQAWEIIGQHLKGLTPKINSYVKKNQTQGSIEEPSSSMVKEEKLSK